MSPLLPPERLREIRARAENATPGPWELVEMGPDSTVHKISVRYCVDHEHSGKLWHNLIRLEDTAYAQHCSWDQRAKDAVFIAEARTAVPQLLDALETAEERADHLQKHHDQYHHGPCMSPEWIAEQRHKELIRTTALEIGCEKLVERMSAAESLVRTLGEALEDAAMHIYSFGAQRWHGDIRRALTQFQEFQTHQEAE